MYNNIIIIIIIIIIYVTQSKLDLQGEKSWNKHYQLLYWILKCLFFFLCLEDYYFEIPYRKSCHLNELHGQTSVNFLLLYRFHILNHITGGQTGSHSTEQLFKWIYWHVFSFYFCRTYWLWTVAPVRYSTLSWIVMTFRKFVLEKWK